jgi:sugar lactone lactonase YvrE
MPDGMTIDAEGGLWVALWGGGAVHRYTPDGRLDTVVEVPADQVSACTFGGAELADLFITTSRQDLPPEAEPAAGALFHLRPGVTGLPTSSFAG